MKIFSIGFTQKTAEEFFGILKDNEIDCLVDVRLNPNGQLSRFAFEKDLPFFLSRLADGCEYVHRSDLAPQKELLQEIRTKGSAMSKDYRLFEKEFNQYLIQKSDIENFLERFGKYHNVVLLCSEPTIEKCHRRLICDMLLSRFGNDIEFGGHL
jgi:uncharacterized protein (DUF488 family)